jgi:GNAT superfamily N-acetyltransferase
VITSPLDVAWAIGRSDTDLWTAWFHAVQSIPGNPYGIEIRRFGSATVLFSDAIPLSYYNRCMGLGPEDAGQIHDIVAFFRERATPFRFDMNPFETTELTRTRLELHGIIPTEYQTNLYGVAAPAKRPPIASGVRIRPVRANEIKFFAHLYERAYCHGRPVSPRLSTFRMDGIRARFCMPGWHFCMALVDGLPAGGGLMYVDGRIASLAGGATVFTLRGRGCQSALLRYRIEHARALGASLVVSRCRANSTSQRNMERAGLVTAYTKVVWEQVLD